MRLLRELEAPTAQRLGDALADQGIAVELKPGAETVGVWVIDETHMPRAGELASGWLDGGDEAGFEQSAARGRRVRELSAHVEERRQRHVAEMTRRLRAAARPRPTPLTIGLIALCVGVAILTGLGDDKVVSALMIADKIVRPTETVIPLLGRTVPWLELPFHEPWRLVTPVLVHFGLFHIIFNMLWLWDLGRTVEAAHGSRYLAAFVLLCAVISNVAQYEIGGHPRFAGMSGVVYGLLGFVWLRGRLDPWVGYGVSSGTMQFMLIWFVLGFVGDFGIANWCHMFGLLVGLGWALVANKLAGRSR